MMSERKKTTEERTKTMPLAPMMTRAEMADFLGIGDAYSYRLMQQPGFPAVKLGNSYRIFRDELIDWLKAHPAQGTCG